MVALQDDKFSCPDQGPSTAQHCWLAGGGNVDAQSEGWQRDSPTRPPHNQNKDSKSAPNQPDLAAVSWTRLTYEMAYFAAKIRDPAQHSIAQHATCRVNSQGKQASQSSQTNSEQEAIDNCSRCRTLLLSFTPGGGCPHHNCTKLYQSEEDFSQPCTHVCVSTVILAAALCHSCVGQYSSCRRQQPCTLSQCASARPFPALCAHTPPSCTQALACEAFSALYNHCKIMAWWDKPNWVATTCPTVSHS